LAPRWKQVNNSGLYNCNWGGCYLGSRLARLNHPEALAVGFAMNARGSTEVILATIGLTIGVLNQQLFTVIVLMAVVTTVCMLMGGADAG
jgi:Kef-type K+ transport system membrane component KefB